jgi:hypothetical protein
MYSYIFLISFYNVSDDMNYLVTDGVNSLRKREYDEVPESSNNHRGALRPPVSPPSPPMPSVSLEQLLASQNAIM